VGADDVEHDDVTGLQLAEEDTLEEGLEDLGVGRAFDRHHGADAHEDAEARRAAQHEQQHNWKPQ
jgi:hypothetical protein